MQIQHRHGVSLSQRVPILHSLALTSRTFLTPLRDADRGFVATPLHPF